MWNEANLEVFWSGTRDEWMRLYDVTAKAVKDVDPRISVGGPSSAASGWVDALLEHARRSRARRWTSSPPTRTAARRSTSGPTLTRLGFPDARILWTEWGVTPTHFNPVNDGTSAATFLLTGMRPRPAGSTRCRTGWPATTSRSSAGRHACCTAASD